MKKIIENGDYSAFIEANQLGIEKVAVSVDESAWHKALKMMSRIPVTGDLEEVIDKVPYMFSMAKDTIAGKYKKISINTLLGIAGCVVYLVTPVDCIPDCIIGLGLLDDAAVVTFTINSIMDDLNRYIIWCKK